MKQLVFDYDLMETSFITLFEQESESEEIEHKYRLSNEQRTTVKRLCAYIDTLGQRVYYPEELNELGVTYEELMFVEENLEDYEETLSYLNNLSIAIMNLKTCNSTSTLLIL